MLFKSNFAVGNLQLSVGKLQLPAPSPNFFLFHDATPLLFGTSSRRTDKLSAMRNAAW